MIKKVVLIGPESTGKSTLCKQLAEHYKTLWVPEFAREYLERNGTDYSYDNLLTIAKGQLKSEENYTANKIADVPSPLENNSPTFSVNPVPLLFIDTDMYVMKVWCEFVFDKCHNWILNQIATRKYDFYLLCNLDLPWVEDNLREYPDLDKRQKLYCYYKDSLVNQHVPWIDITGNYQQRFDKAVREIDFITS